MLMGTLVYGIRYTIPEYVCTLLVAGGVSAFALLKVRKLIFVFFCFFLYVPFMMNSECFQTSSKTMKKLANPNAPLGYGLCFLNLAFDGFTNATQDSISTRYFPDKISPVSTLLIIIKKSTRTRNKGLFQKGTVISFASPVHVKHSHVIQQLLDISSPLIMYF